MKFKWYKICRNKYIDMKLKWYEYLKRKVELDIFEILRKIIC